jgi:hypothetical protein
MRLINTKTGELMEFYGKAIPFYAILSHRWEEEEVTFRDYHSSKKESMKGYQKILKARERAASEYLEWIWVDTCCIDKSSSAELSEAVSLDRASLSEACTRLLTAHTR